MRCFVAAALVLIACGSSPPPDVADMTMPLPACNAGFDAGGFCCSVNYVCAWSPTADPAQCQTKNLRLVYGSDPKACAFCGDCK